MREDTGVKERLLTPEEMSQGVDSYFALCEEEKKRPTLPGLCNALGISTDTWDSLRRQAEEGAEGMEDFLWPIRRGMQTLADALEQRTDSMASFLLKQPCYGRYGEGEKNPPALLRVTFGGTGREDAEEFAE